MDYSTGSDLLREAGNKEICNLPDIRQAINLTMLVDSDSYGANSSDKAMEYPAGMCDNKEVEKDPKGLAKAVMKDAKNRQKLISMYSEAQDFYMELPKHLQLNLNQVFPDIESTFVKKKMNLETNECTILVSGEPNAGKSSLINLILGVDLLPTRELSCTATICEIRTDKQGVKEAVAHYRKKHDEINLDKKVHRSLPRIIDLGDKDGKGIEELHQVLQETDTNGNSPYSKVELNWPFSVLEEGIVIVDTPGLEGMESLSQHVSSYLEKSFGFIYVINSTSGVQKERLQNFVRTVIHSAGEEGFNPDSTLFVTNKWDLTEEKDRPKLKENIRNKLTRFYPELKEDQLCFLSIKQALAGIILGTQTADHTDLNLAVEKLLPESLRSKLYTQYRWLSVVLKRSLYNLKVSAVMASKNSGKIQEQYQQLESHMSKIEQNVTDTIDRVRNSLATEADNIRRRVLKTLQSKEVLMILMDWKSNEVPVETDPKWFLNEAVEKIAEKVAVQINLWEKTNNIVGTIKHNIINGFKRDFQLMEYQIAKCQSALLGGEHDVATDLHHSIKKHVPIRTLFKRHYKKEDEHVRAVRGLGGAISELGILDNHTRKELKDLKKHFKKRSPENMMQEATALYVDSIFQAKDLGKRIHNNLCQLMKGIDSMAHMILDFMKADRNLFETLRKDRNDEVLTDVYSKMMAKGSHLQGRLDLFFVQNIMKFDYKPNDIEWSPDTAPIGSGSFADVYVANLKDGTRSESSLIPVALKVFRDRVKTGTITSILLEDRVLRNVEHEHIIKYYGATYRYKNPANKKRLQWIMIMEICNETLKEIFVSDESENPGKLTCGSSQQLHAEKVLAKYAVQICSGLQYLHEKGLVHRDLKLDNILVDQNNVVKLSDVGLTKSEEFIAHTVTGSPAYMAPEVLLQSERNYDHRADIFSLGIILWEMWYGIDAADHILTKVVGSFEENVQNGLRPSLMMDGLSTPPDEWVDRINAAWAYEPKHRPELQDLIYFFKDILSKT